MENSITSFLNPSLDLLCKFEEPLSYKLLEIVVDSLKPREIRKVAREIYKRMSKFANMAGIKLQGLCFNKTLLVCVSVPQNQ